MTETDMFEATPDPLTTRQQRRRVSRLALEQEIDNLHTRLHDARNEISAARGEAYLASQSAKSARRWARTWKMAAKQYRFLQQQWQDEALRERDKQETIATAVDALKDIRIIALAAYGEDDISKYLLDIADAARDAIRTLTYES